jgi:uncharacterized protein (TIGR02186 family)
MTFCAAHGAKAEKLTVALSSDHIVIDSNFSGASLTIFGDIERDTRDFLYGRYDLIMVVRGPSGAVTIREKKQAGLFWLNADEHVFNKAPSFLAILSDRPIIEMVDYGNQQRLGGSIEAQVGRVTGEGETDFSSALIRIRRKQGLFIDEPDAITFLSPTLFRAAIRLPGYAPLGAYEIETEAFADGLPVGRTKAAFSVRRSGIEHRLAVAAQDHGVLYGFAVIIMALSMGLIASVIFRRD